MLQGHYTHILTALQRRAHLRMQMPVALRMEQYT
jgi:hypothetical protein